MVFCSYWVSSKLPFSASPAVMPPRRGAAKALLDSSGAHPQKPGDASRKAPGILHRQHLPVNGIENFSVPVHQHLEDQAVLLLALELL